MSLRICFSRSGICSGVIVDTAKMSHTDAHWWHSFIETSGITELCPRRPVRRNEHDVPLEPTVNIEIQRSVIVDGKVDYESWVEAEFVDGLESTAIDALVYALTEWCTAPLDAQVPAFTEPAPYAKR